MAYATFNMGLEETDDVNTSIHQIRPNRICLTIRNAAAYMADVSIFGTPEQLRSLVQKINAGLDQCEAEQAKKLQDAADAVTNAVADYDQYRDNAAQEAGSEAQALT